MPQSNLVFTRKNATNLYEFVLVLEDIVTGQFEGTTLKVWTQPAQTAAIVTTKAIYELHRTGGRYALVTMCIGGGQGIAAIFERA